MKRSYKVVHWREYDENTNPQTIIENTEKEARKTAYWFAVYQSRSAEVYETITNQQGQTIEERILKYWHDNHGLQVETAPQEA